MRRSTVRGKFPAKSKLYRATTTDNFYIFMVSDLHHNLRPAEERTRIRFSAALYSVANMRYRISVGGWESAPLWWCSEASRSGSGVTIHQSGPTSTKPGNAYACDPVPWLIQSGR